MPKPAFSDQHFINLWNRFQSPSELAKHLAMEVRSIQARRKNIERRYGILLTASREQGGNMRPELNRLIMSSRRDINRLELPDGMVVVGSDAHYAPGVIPLAHKALCNLVFDMGKRVSAVILNGDILDGGQISRHPRGGWSSPPTVKEELQAVQERLSDIEAAISPGTRLLRTYGNHCARFESRLAAQVPEYEGVAGFTLREHLPRWTDSLRIDINEDVVVIHDWHSGLHSGWNDVLKGGCSVVTGHTHELGFKAHKGFKDRIHYGVKTGMLADEDQRQFDYRNGKPGMNWRSGFAVLTFVDGLLVQPEFCAVESDGRAWFRGKQYI